MRKMNVTFELIGEVETRTVEQVIESFKNRGVNVKAVIDGDIAQIWVVKEALI